MGNLVQQFQKAVVLMMDNTTVTLTGDAVDNAAVCLKEWNETSDVNIVENAEWRIMRIENAELAIFCDQINEIIYEVSPDDIVELNVFYHHDEIKGDIDTVAAHETQYSYSIDQTGNSPENFLLTIWIGEVEDHTTFEYNYPTQEEAEEDVALLESEFCIDIEKI